MSIEQDAAEIIESAVELIDEKGWIQGDLENEDGLCMIGGLDRAARYQYGFWGKRMPRFYQAVDAVYSSLPESEKEFEVADFNDTAGRTWGECRDVMISAAKTLREAG